LGCRPLASLIRGTSATSSLSGPTASTPSDSATARRHGRGSTPVTRPPGRRSSMAVSTPTGPSPSRRRPVRGRRQRAQAVAITTSTLDGAGAGARAGPDPDALGRARRPRLRPDHVYLALIRGEVEGRDGVLTTGDVRWI